ncbi:MAG: hypothetical protein WD749_05705 [Phycisphaerales bacterium]
MTTPSNTPPTPPSRRSLRRTLGTTLVVAALGAAMMVSSAGCQKKNKKPPPPPPPPPVVVETPEPIDIDALLQEMRPDARVKFAGQTAPADRTLAEGVVRLADALAKGDGGAMKKMLDRSGQGVLDELQSSGTWEDETRKIEQVRVVYLSDTLEREPSSATVAMAIQDPGGAYLLGWTLRRDGEGWSVAAAPTPSDTRARASDFDGQRISAALAPRDEGGDATPEEEDNRPKEEAPAPANEPPPTAPGRKNTPAGPINIPG